MSTSSKRDKFFAVRLDERGQDDEAGKMFVDTLTRSLVPVETTHGIRLGDLVVVPRDMLPMYRGVGGRSVRTIKEVEDETRKKRIKQINEFNVGTREFLYYFGCPFCYNEGRKSDVNTHMHGNVHLYEPCEPPADTPPRPKGTPGRPKKYWRELATGDRKPDSVCIRYGCEYYRLERARYDAGFRADPPRSEPVVVCMLDRNTDMLWKIVYNDSDAPDLRQPDAGNLLDFNELKDKYDNRRRAYARRLGTKYVKVKSRFTDETRQQQQDARAKRARRRRQEDADAEQSGNAAESDNGEQTDNAASGDNGEDASGCATANE